jgi:hypothetical protein
MRRWTRTYGIPKKVDLLGDMLRKNLKLIGWCRKCDRQTEADPAEQAALHGTDLPVADWRARFICAACAVR